MRVHPPIIRQYTNVLTLCLSMLICVLYCVDEMYLIHESIKLSHPLLSIQFLFHSVIFVQCNFSISLMTDHLSIHLYLQQM